MPDQLFNKIFNLPGDDRTSLEQLIREFPYFSLAHFYLLKLTGTDDSSFPGIAAKTAIHFNNPFLLQHSLLREQDQKEVAGVDVFFQNTPVEQEIQVAGEKQEGETRVDQRSVINEQQDVLEEENKTGDPIAVDDNHAGQPAENKQEELLFEPLYTSDYFASQGIKLSQEAEPTDKLGKQLKSFTEWLKTMKKVHDNKLYTDIPVDLAVQNMAEKSNQEEEIITESMAEVFEQQGKHGKARDIYRKLSLLNPSKSAYFAAKIEHLNNQ